MPEAMIGYDEDLFLWTQQQAAALRDAARRGANLPIDWENLAEEIESLGKSDRRRVISHIRTIIEHLLKLETSPAGPPRAGWTESIFRARGEAEEVLADSPSLRRQVPELIETVRPKAVRLAILALRAHGEEPDEAALARHAAGYGPEQILGDWLPPDSAGG